MPPREFDFGNGLRVAADQDETSPGTIAMIGAGDMGQALDHQR